MSIKNKSVHESLFLNIALGSLLAMLIFALGACTTTTTPTRRYPLYQDRAPAFKINVNKIPNAVPKAEPLSKQGNPKSYVISGHRYYVMKSAKGYHARGIASWYGMKFHHFQTANGEIYNVAGMTAAHKTLPLPTYLQVTNLRNGKKIIVKVNDRGPFVSNRIIDLSYAAAKKLAMTERGTAPVEIRAIIPGITRLAAHTPKPAKTTIVAANKKPAVVRLGLFKQREKAKQLALLVKKWSPSPVTVEKTTIHHRIYYQVVISHAANLKQIDRKLRLARLNVGEK
jgi:rare lipoprotein A